MTQLTIENVSLGYDNHAVREHLSFIVEAGDYLAVLGENGAGKTTLMRTILGLLPPKAGKISFGNGLDRRELGYLPQINAVQHDFPAHVREIVRSGCLSRMGSRPFYGDAEKRLAEESMARLGIENLASRCFRELSGGQQQRVLLARAICASRKMLLLDEPVSGLDPQAAAEMYEIIGSLNDDGVSIIMISHDVNQALKYAKSVLYLGERDFFGTTAEYIEYRKGGGNEHID